MDHPSEVKELDQTDNALWPGYIPVWVNIDVGDHREGVPTGSAQLAEVASAISASGRVRLEGVYTHMGSSYSSGSPDEALQYFSRELEGLRNGAESFLQSMSSEKKEQMLRGRKVTLSLGATPTATSVQNLVEDRQGAKQYREALEKMKKSFAVELHAGVYPVMDMQQMATRARPEQSASDPAKSLLSYSQLGFRVLVEVSSLYFDRGEKPEALIAAGTIALGREVCKSYAGWAVVTPWPSKSGDHYDPDGSRTGWIVGRTSQEHGILTWEGPRETMRQLEYGQKLLLWPNHACITGVNFGWYLVVDSDKGDADIIQDVWIRWRGW
jgi:D-serine deaminase-like pyridoxal phosphate-dependent protein